MLTPVYVIGDGKVLVMDNITRIDAYPVTLKGVLDIRSYWALVGEEYVDELFLSEMGRVRREIFWTTTNVSAHNTNTFPMMVSAEIAMRRAAAVWGHCPHNVCFATRVKLRKPIARATQSAVRLLSLCLSLSSTRVSHAMRAV